MSTQNQIEELPYWQHLNGDGDMAENKNHSKLIQYILSVLEWFYQVQNWLINNNMVIIEPDFEDVSPDIAIHLGLVLSPEEQASLKSWRLGEPNRPAPVVIFEVCSEGTWPNDVRPQDKPLRYQQMGVKEYFVYDPTTPRLWREPNRRLRGWRYDGRQGVEFITSQELIPDERGWLFSEQLDGYLSPDGNYLRLHDRQGNILLSEKEVAQQAQADARRSTQEKAELFTKLRAMGINPDDL